MFDKKTLIKNFRTNPKVFYIYYSIMVKSDIKFDELVCDLKSLNELIGYKTAHGRKHHEDHQYNFAKNVFWSKCGLNDWLKKELEDLKK